MSADLTVSVPSVKGNSPAATAAADEELPHRWLWLQGLSDE